MSEIQAVLTALENAPTLLASLILAVPEPLRRRRPAPGRWSAHENLCHLTSLEPRFRAPSGAHARRRRSGSRAPLPPPPKSRTERCSAWISKRPSPPSPASGASSRARLRELPDEAWKRSARHPDYASYNVFVLARHMVVHDMLHGYRIEETLQRREWPDEIAGAPPEPEHPTVETGLPGTLGGMKPGEVNILGPFAVPGLAPRLVRVYLPRNYNPAEPHFGLYLFDGQNDFDDMPSFSGGWYVHEAVEGLAKTKRPVPVVIGIDHGGAERILELSPFAVEEANGKLEILLAWVTGQLMPALTAELNLIPGPLGAVIGGSSMGGLAAFWSHFRHPEAFGGSLVMSPSFWLSNQAIFADIAARPTPEVSRLYLDAGAREDKGRVVEAVKTMAEHLVGRGYDSDRLMWRADSRGTHSEGSWRRRLPAALRFMYRRG